MKDWRLDLEHRSHEARCRSRSEKLPHLGAALRIETPGHIKAEEVSLFH
jgi:hypothetical protein